MPTTEPRHPKLRPNNGGIHVIHAYEYANAAARTGATGFVSDDLGKVAWQQDDDTFWVLTAVTPTWSELTGGGGGGGEANTAANVGGGAGSFRDKTGVTLNMRSLTGTARLTVTENTDTVAFDAVPAQIEAVVAGSTRPPTAHASSHVGGGPDAIAVATTSVAGLMSASDKTFLDSLSGSSSDFRDLVLFDHFQSSNADADEIGLMGWRTYVNGTGAAVDFTGEVGHPGVLRVSSGTQGAARCAIACGDSAGVGGKIFVTGTQNAITLEMLLKFSGAGSIDSANLEEMIAGFGLEWTGDNTITNGVFLRFAPPGDTNYQLVCVTGGTATVSNSGIAPTANRWDRWEIVITSGAPSSVQLRQNGVNVGSAVTTNVPSAGLGVGIKLRSAGGANALLLCDYIKVQQITAKEDP